MHSAAKFPSQAHHLLKLIKRGKDINEKDWCLETPLHSAVTHRNYVGVCMLLFYGADVYITSTNDVTPLKRALSLRFHRFEEFKSIINVLIDHYDREYFLSKHNYELFEAVPKELKLKCEGGALLVHSFRDLEQFKVIWAHLKFCNVLTDVLCIHFLTAYINYARFPNRFWLDYLYLILDCLGKHNNNFGEFKDSFFGYLCRAFCKREIRQDDRRRIINTCLALGAPVSQGSYINIMFCYGFSDELEAMIYADNRLDTLQGSRSSNMLKCLFGWTDKQSFTEFFVGFWADSGKNSWKVCDVALEIKFFVSVLKLLAPTPFIKVKIKYLYKHLRKDLRKLVYDQVNNAPEFPSLVELSRNEARNFIHRNFDIRYPYQFQETIKMLKIPEGIQLLLLLRQPVY